MTHSSAQQQAVHCTKDLFLHSAAAPSLATTATFAFGTLHVFDLDPERLYSRWQRKSLNETRGRCHNLYWANDRSGVLHL